MPNVTMTLTGTMGGSTLTDGSGNYTFSSLTPGGAYTVTPTKSALTPGSAGINTVDVIAVQRHFLILGTPLSGCRLTAADVNGVGGINTVDVIAIQRFFLGNTTGIANTGNASLLLRIARILGSAAARAARITTRWSSATSLRGLSTGRGISNQ